MRLSPNLVFVCSGMTVPVPASRRHQAVFVERFHLKSSAIRMMQNHVPMILLPPFIDYLQRSCVLIKTARYLVEYCSLPVNGVMSDLLSSLATGDNR